MSHKSLKETLQAFGLKKVLSYLENDPDNNIPKIIEWIERFDKEKSISSQLITVKSAIEDKNSNWYKLIKSLYTDVDFLNAGILQCLQLSCFVIPFN